MVRISKGMAVTAALIAFGLVTVDDTARGLAKSAPSMAQFEDARSDAVVVQETALRERATAALHALRAAQNAKSVEPAIGSNCREQTWPYYTTNCLMRDNSEGVPAAVRIIPTQRYAENSTLATRPQ